MPTTITKQLLSADSVANSKSMAFDGSDDMFGSAVGEGLSGAADHSYSYSLWFKADSLQTKKLIGFAGRTSGQEYIRSDIAITSNGKIYVGEGGGAYNQDLAYTGYSATTWYHMAITSIGDGTTNSVQVYLNGSQIYEFEGYDGANWKEYDFCVGALRWASTIQYPFDGLVDEVGVWRGTVLTPDEVGLIYSRGAPTDLGNTTGLTVPDSYYRMGDLDDTDGLAGVVKDRIGSYDLTAGNTSGSGAPAASTDVPPISSRAIEVVATSSPGTLIHTASATSGTIDELYIQAANEDVHPVDLTLEWGGVTDADHMMLTIPSHTGDNLVVAGRILTGGLEVRAYASSARKIKLLGYANRVAQEFTPASIADLLIWVDPSDLSKVETSGGIPGTTGEAIVKVIDKAGASGSETPEFAMAGGYQGTLLADPGGGGNGLPFLLHDSGSTNIRMIYTPTVSPFNLVNGAGSMGLSEDWLTWIVLLRTATMTNDEGGAMRGNSYNSTPGEGHVQKYWDGSAWADGKKINVRGDWVSGSANITWRQADSVPYVNSLDKVSAFFLQSYDDGGTQKLRASQDGSTWRIWDHGETGSVSVAGVNNVYMIAVMGSERNGIGELGFCNASVSDADIASLYSYLDDKWDLEI